MAIKDPKNAKTTPKLGQKLKVRMMGSYWIKSYPALSVDQKTAVEHYLNPKDGPVWSLKRQK